MVVRLGRNVQIRPGMESLFPTDKISLRMKVKESSRLHSLWEVVDPNATIPFERGEFIVFNQSTESLFDQIPSLKKRLKKLEKKKIK